MIQEFRMTRVVRRIAVRCEKNNRAPQSDFVDIFMGLTLKDWIVNSLLGMSCLGPAVAHVRSM
jgi:hypothetical protein